jgi:acyl-CoA-binding protein
MQTRGEQAQTEEENKMLLSGYDDIFPGEVPRGMTGDTRVWKGGAQSQSSQNFLYNSYRDAPLQKQQVFETMPKGQHAVGASTMVRNVAMCGACLILLLFLMALGGLICLLVWPPGKRFWVYSGIVNSLGYWYTKIAPGILLVIIVVFALLVFCCVPMIIAPAFKKPPKPNDPLIISGTVCLSIGAIILLALVLFGWWIWWATEGAAYRTSNQVCGTYHDAKSPTAAFCAKAAVPAAAITTTAVAANMDMLAAPTTAPTLHVLQTATTAAPGKGQVSCGNHIAASCALCGNNAGSCSGSCRWAGGGCVSQAAAAAIPGFGSPGTRRLNLPPLREVLEAGPDVDLDADIEEDGKHQGAFLPQIPPRRRLQVNRSLEAGAFGEAASKVLTNPDCAGLQDFCLTPTAAGKVTTACVCRQEAKGDQGNFCKKWKPTDVKPWCHISATAVCPGVAAQGTPNQIPSGTFIQSSAPCVGVPTSKYEGVLAGRKQFMLALIVDSILSLMALCTCCCGLFICAQSLGPKGAGGKQMHMRGHTQADMNGAFKTTSRLGANTPVPTRMPLEDEFRFAQEEASRKLSDGTQDEQRFELYGFFHQAVQGNIQGERPSFFHKEDQMKYDSWTRLRGMPRNEAMRRYIDAVKNLPDLAQEATY